MLDQGGDPITQLPVDKTEPTTHEARIVDTLFKKNKKAMSRLADELKDPLFVGLLFFLASLPQTDALFKKIPAANSSPYILMACKILAVMIVYWVVKHFYLSKKTA